MADDASPSTAARPSSLRHANNGPNGSSKTDGGGSSSTTTHNNIPSTGVSSGVSAPPGHAIRRARTVAESNPGAARWVPPSSTRRLSSDSSGFEPPPSRGNPPPFRRSSNFSDRGLNDARAILNPHAKAAQGTAADQPPELSSLAGLSLAFALLPALAGALFTGGGAVATDIMLLGLAGVFLHWSVTQPWLWYHSAQQVRIQHEANSADEVFDDDSDDDDGDDDEEFVDGASHLDHVPEEDALRSENDESTPEKKTPSPSQQSALSELYLHEVTALLSCFSLPLISAFILHMIRSQLSRPSEGLVSNYNLTIFILVSEVRVLSHMIKLVQARTLHLQRVVHSNPFGALPAANSVRINAILERLDALESDSAAAAAAARTAAAVLSEQDEDEETNESAKAAQEAVLAKDIRGAIQPELDALNRAVRRYEKKSTLLQSQVDAHFAAMDARVQDAIALAAVAAKNSARSSILVRGFAVVVKIVLFPFHAVLQLLLLPARWVLSFTRTGGGARKKGMPNGAQTGGKPSSRSTRGSKTTGQPRYNGDKMPSRLARK
ncbi:hypothetical protein A9K55_004838 [Cordyceps militaris]|uniref:Uncharacterized protein n=1 Tax=Cordyceps militaris TaxID=73501 RepID=A0A2H4SQ98_CORMI|nr:hypothetical protein A9K55_004838 [Cordyceps militaris]